MLNTSSLKKAIDALTRSLNIVGKRQKEMGDDLFETVKAGVIQNFEVAYELSWKFIQRWIKENRTPEDATHPRTRKDLFRLAARLELIKDPLPWFTYGDARNLTSHTYDGKKADIVYQAAESFLEDAKYLLEQLDSHND